MASPDRPNCSWRLPNQSALAPKKFQVNKRKPAASVAALLSRERLRTRRESTSRNPKLQRLGSLVRE